MIPRQIDSKVRRLREKADQVFAERKWEKALALYTESEERGPYDPRIGQRIAELHRRLGQKSEAVTHYKKAARYYSEQGFWAKAVAVSKMILEIDPSDHQVRNQLAHLYSAQGKASEQSQLGKTSEERAALSISKAEPRRMDSPPLEDPGVFGNTISLAGEEPRTIDLSPEDEIPSDVAALGPPLGKFSKVPFFSEMQPNELSAVLERLAVRRSPAGSYVCEEGDAGDSMYILAEGAVEVSVKEPDGSRLVLARLQGGDFFGEYSLLTRSARNATVSAKTEVELLEITRRDFDVISAEHPRIWTILQDHLKQRVLDTIFSRSPVFRALSRKDREALALGITAKAMKMDDVVMIEKTDGDEMYFIKSGSVVVTATQGKDRVVIGELGPGDYFGEIALLTGKPRTATVRARTDGELFCLKRKDAAPVLRQNREILDLLRAKMTERAKDTLSAMESYQESRITLI